MQPAAVGPAQTRYDLMVPKRRAYEYRAEKVAAVTIPALFPPEGHDGEDTLRTPYQSVGARGVNNLSSKLLLTLLSSTAPFFRMRVDPSSEEALEANNTNGINYRPVWAQSLNPMDMIVSG